MKNGTRALVAFAIALAAIFIFVFVTRRRSVVARANGAAPSFADDVRPLFRDRDIDAMRRAGGFDLGRYEDVRARADRILDRLEAGDMPCDGAWSSDKVATFRRWVEAGTPE